MEGLSPDVPAWISYAVLFTISLVGALATLNNLLGEHRGYWRYLRTWLLFLMYLAFPIVLFWALDELGVVHDSSLLAAVAIGLLYRPIMNGSVNIIPIPGEPSRYWQPFTKFADKLAEQISSHTRERVERLYDQIHDVVSADVDRMAKLSALAFEFSADRTALKDQLDEIDSADAGNHLDPDEFQASQRRLKVKRMLSEIRRHAPKTWGALLSQRGVLTTTQYWKWVIQVGDRAVAPLITLVILASAFQLGAGFREHPWQDRYHLWRLQKAHASPADKYRTFVYMREHAATETDDVLLRAIRLLESGAVVRSTVEDVLRLLTYSNSDEPNKRRLAALTAALRTEDAVARQLINQYLLAFARRFHGGVYVDDALVDWVPDAGEKPFEIAHRIRLWEQWIDSLPQGGSEVPEGVL